MPLEDEPSAALALTFTGVPVIELELFGFLGRLSGVAKTRPPLVSTTPYRPGLIPVVFVHGTASSIVRWVEIYNRLQARSGHPQPLPVLVLPVRFRQPHRAVRSCCCAIRCQRAVEKLDPQGKDPALRQMVLIGHSQGGLLVKMQVVDTGDQIWNAASKMPLDELGSPTRPVI